MIESVWHILILFGLIEVAYQVTNFVVKKLNNIPIPNSKEEE